MNGSVNVSTTALPVATLVSSGALSCSQTSVTLTALGGNSYTFSSPSGPIVSNGNTVTVSQEGLYSVTVASASGCVSTTSTTVTSTTATVTVSNPTTTTGTVGSVFSQSFTATGGVTPRSFGIATASLPPGLNLTPTGVLSGTPTLNGTYNLTVRATDANGCSGESATYKVFISVLDQPIRYVKQGGSGDQSGNSWANASGDLQSQIDIAGAQQVWVAGGTYQPASGGSFSMKEGVAIYGGFSSTSPESSTASRPSVNPVTGPGGASQPSSTTLLGNGNSVIRNALGLTSGAVLDGFVIQGGNNTRGGGMFNYNSSSPRLTNLVFSHNSAFYGGGIHNEFDSKPSLTNCVFSSNSATSGGGIFNLSGSQAELVNCVISSNSAVSGAGIYNTFQAGCRLINCKLVGNVATQDGGGIFTTTNGSLVSLFSCTLSGNSAVNGGGVYNDSGVPTLINCLIQDNKATGKGGGIYFTQMANYGSLTNCLLQGNSAQQGGALFNNIASPTLTNCTISDNTASQGGALYNTYFSPTLASSIVWHNHTGTGVETTYVNTDGSTILTRYCLIESGVTSYSAGEGNQMATVSPFVSSTDFTLSAGSQAIDAGDPASNTATSGATDLAGNSRLANGRIDMGAYEYQSPFCQPLAITQQPASSSSVCAGSTVTAMVSVSGTVSSYQWYRDGQVVTGQTSATLILTNLQPSQAGAYAVVVAGGCNSLTSTAFSLTVNPLPAASLTASPSMVLSCAQTSLTLTAGSGTSYTFTNGSGTLGTSGATNTLVVDSPGTYSVSVTNASGCVSTTSTTVISNTATVDVSIPATTTATVNSAFSQSFTASGGSGLYSYSLASGRLPTGVSLSTSGVLSGSPTQGGSFSLTVRATDANGCSGISVPYTLSVLGGQLTLTAPSYDCASGAFTFHTTGGDGSLIEYFAIGITPWTSNPTQQIEAELRADPKKIQLLARQNGLTVSYLFDLPAYCAGLPTPPQSSTNPAPVVSQGIGAQVAVEREPYHFTIPAGTLTDPQGESLTYYALALPAGLSLQGSVISGTPTTQGRVVVTLIAVDPSGQTANTSFWFTVGPPVPDVTPVLTTLPATQYGKTPFSVVVEVFELNGVSTGGPVTLYLAKDPQVVLSFDGASTFVGGKLVQNGNWTFDGRSNNDFYILTCAGGVSAKGKQSVGLSGVSTPGGTQGRLTLTAMVSLRNGVELRLTNNSDADQIEYFQK